MKDGTMIPADKLRGSAMPKILKGFTTAVLGKKIVQVGYVALGDIPYPVLILDDGSSILAGRDDEGNGPGVFDWAGAKSGAEKLCETNIA